MRRLLLAVLCAAACTTPRVATIGAADVGDDTTITGLGLVNGFKEQPPPGATLDALLDTFTITERDAGKVCVRFLFRTAEEFDVPPSEWEVTLNGERVQPRDTAVQAVGYDYVGNRTVLSAFGTFLGDFAALRVTAPEQRVSYVAERTGVVCGPAADDADVRLYVKWITAQTAILVQNVEWRVR